MGIPNKKTLALALSNDEPDSHSFTLWSSVFAALEPAQIDGNVLLVSVETLVGSIALLAWIINRHFSFAV